MYTGAHHPSQLCRLCSLLRVHRGPLREAVVGREVHWRGHNAGAGEMGLHFHRQWQRRPSVCRTASLRDAGRLEEKMNGWVISNGPKEADWVLHTRYRRRDILSQSTGENHGWHCTCLAPRRPSRSYGSLVSSAVVSALRWSPTLMPSGHPHTQSATRSSVSRCVAAMNG